MSIKVIADVLEVEPATISNWLFRCAKQCEKVNEDLMNDLNVSKVEMDELWVIVKKKLCQEQKLKITEHGCGVSFAPKSKLIIDFILGPRKQYVADELIKVTDKHLSDLKPFFTTDGLKFYAKALLKKYGERIEFPRTGLRGRPKNPALVPDKDLK